MDVLSPTWIHDLIQAYGLWALFTVIMLESMGVPMPGETALVTAALYAGTTHKINIVSVVLIAAMAAVIGDNIGYLIGRSIGIRLVLRYGGYIRLNERRLKVGQYLFLRHGGKIVFFGRFVAFLRIFAALLAGVNRMNFFHFLIMNALGGICWAWLGGAFRNVIVAELNPAAWRGRAVTDLNEERMLGGVTGHGANTAKEHDRANYRVLAQRQRRVTLHGLTPPVLLGSLVPQRLCSAAKTENYY